MSGFNEPEGWEPPKGVDPNYAERLHALGVELTEQGQVRSLGNVLEGVVAEGGMNLDLDTAMKWTARVHAAETELEALVHDVAGMIDTIRLAEALEGESAASTLALDALEHINSHLETMTFQFLYGTTADRDVVREAVFGPRSTEEESDG
jgi:hypothetical protein